MAELNRTAGFAVGIKCIVVALIGLEDQLIYPVSCQRTCLYPTMEHIAALE